MKLLNRMAQKIYASIKFMAGPAATVKKRFQTGWLFMALGALLASSSPTKAQ